ncbi:MAG: class I SAM-dependent methyltransferase [Chlamydiota bacterium]
MIDCDVGEYQVPDRHLEYFIESPFMAAKSTENLSKEKAMKSLKITEGWCTEFKASILYDIVSMMKPDKVVEIGVWGGSSLIPMAYALKNNGYGIIYGIDPWSQAESAAGQDGVNRQWWSTVNHDIIFSGLKNTIVKLGLYGQIHLVRSTSKDAEIIEEIDILHIDGNHSEITSYLDVTKWVPQVRKGGLIIFDDINWATTSKAVAWLDEHCVKLIEYKDVCTWGIWVKKD